MTLFARVVSGLIKGDFICTVTDYEAFQFLTSAQLRNDMTNQEDVDQYLRRLGLRLTTTRDEGAFFAAHAEIDGEGKKAVRTRFTELKNHLRPMVSFMELVMRVTGDDNAISPGEKLDLNRVMARISENTGLTEQLRKTASDTGITTKDGSDRERLNKIVKRFRDDRYLQLVNPESEIYMFTGRVEWLLEAIEFLMLHDKISDEDSAFDQRVEA